MRGGYAPRTSPYPPGLSWRCFKRRNDTGSSRIPSRLAHRARPIRQYQADATSSRLLPPSPAIPGSGCLQLQPAAATASRWTVSHLHMVKQRLAAHTQEQHKFGAGRRPTREQHGRNGIPRHTLARVLKSLCQPNYQDGCALAGLTDQYSSGGIGRDRPSEKTSQGLRCQAASLFSRWDQAVDSS
jgi:hypothetical protein